MRTTWDAVTAQADRTPDAPAVLGESRLTYAALVERASAIADLILDQAMPGDLLALDSETPVTGVLSFLAAARAGCALLPLSGESPSRQRAAILTDARPALVLTGTGASVAVEPLTGSAAGGPGRTDMRGQAYAIYTSGSTGRPKGVMVSHEALLARLTGLAATPGLRQGDRMLAMTALSFDISIAELLLPLVVGAQLVAAPPDARHDPALFAQVASDTSPTVMQATPSFWNLAFAWGWQGAPEARIWCGGEALRASLAGRLTASCGEVWNLYGPTEATIWASACRVSDPDRVALGDALPGSGMCLASDNGDVITGPGQEGEILLYGAGLATGYLGQPELTAARFAVCRTPAGDVRCYRTGDIGRYTPHGALEFVGRGDGQVKVRGHRIELGEIEHVLEEHPGVHQAVAVLREPDGPEQVHIAAFVVADPEVQVAEVRRWISSRLPRAARPAHIQVVPRLPRTVAGKADRVKLAGTLTADAE